MEGESTQPVELPGNPFAADEPTETAFATPPGLPPRMVASVTPKTLRQTQPMRAVGDELPPDGRADTIPPPPEMPKDAAPKQAEPLDVEGPTEPASEGKPAKGKKAKKTDGAAEDDKQDAAPADVKTEPKTDAPSEAKADAPKDKG
jgi:hypothetical protein